MKFSEWDIMQILSDLDHHISLQLQCALLFLIYTCSQSNEIYSFCFVKKREIYRAGHSYLGSNIMLGNTSKIEGAIKPSN